MQPIETIKGDIIKGNDIYPYEVVDEKVRIKLPFQISFEKLNKILKEKGYYVANPLEVDSQGWGKDYDAEGYYPYWVYAENKDHYFAFPPEDYKVSPEPGQALKHIPILGNKAIEEFFHWLPLLKKAKSAEALKF